MKVHSLHQWLLNLLLLLTQCIKVNSANSKIICPQYCKCYIFDGMRSATCVGQRLSNIETNVPSNVQILDISNNSISTLENEGFKKLGLIFLRKLQLRHNHIGNIGLHAFLGVGEIRILDLSYNHLYYLLPATFEDTPKLRSLYLQGNRLKIDPGPILIIPALEILDISSCQLDNFQHDIFSKLPALLSLKLANNQLIKLDVEVLETIEKLQSIDLNRNPWSCDGKARELEAWLRNHHIQHDPLCKTESKGDEKFQKIVSAVDLKNDTEIISDEELLRLWSRNDEDKNSHIKQNSESGCVKPNISISKSGNILQFFDKIPSFWSLIIGLEIGIVVGGIIMWLMNRVNRVRTSPRPRPISRGRSLQALQNRVSLLRLRSTGEDSTVLWTELDNFDCPGTPPPAYRDCFDSLPRINTTCQRVV